MPDIRILTGDCRDRLSALPANAMAACVTSPPYYGLRHYGVDGQIGLKRGIDGTVADLVGVFREVRRVLRADGTLWLNLGDSYAASNAREAGFPAKSLLMIPARVALALQDDGWLLRSHIIWHKPNPVPESVTDRPTSSHGSLFLFAARSRYYYDAGAVREAAVGRTLHDLTGGRYAPPGQPEHTGSRRSRTRIVDGNRNVRNVWAVRTVPGWGGHAAAFPPALIRPCIKAGTPVGGTVLDPFAGTGTTGVVARDLGRNAVLIELDPRNVAIIRQRLGSVG